MFLFSAKLLKNEVAQHSSARENGGLACPDCMSLDLRLTMTSFARFTWSRVCAPLPPLLFCLPPLLAKSQRVL